MKPFSLTLALLCLAGGAQAHGADLTLLEHALEHGWFALAPLPLLLLLLPIGRARR